MRTAGEGVEQRGARARTCSSLRGRKVLELTCAMLRGVDHARPWWPGSTMQLQRREFGKRFQRMGGTGPQTRPQIHPPSTYSARPPCMHQHTHRLHMQAPRRCPHPSSV